MADQFDQFLAQEEDEFEQFAETAAPLPAAAENPTPYQHKPRPMIMAGSGGMVVDEDTTPPGLVKAAEAGVNIDKRLPAKESFLSSLAANPAEKDAYVTSYIKARYGDDTPVRAQGSGSVSGQVEFWNPEDEQWQVAEAGAMAAGGDLMEAMPSALGAMGGSALGSAGGPVGTAGGGAAGAGLGQAAGRYARLKLGQQFGLNQSMGDPSLIEDAAGAGAQTTAIDLGLSALYGAWRGAKALVMGKQYLTPAQAKELLFQQKRADALIDEVRKTTGVDFQPFTGAIAPDTEAGSKLLSAGQEVMSDPTVGPKMSKRITTNEQALVKYLDEMTLQTRLDAPGEGAVPLKEAVAEERLDGPRRMMDLQNRRAQTSTKSVLEKIPPPTPASAGQGVRAGLNAKYQSAKATRKQAYATYQSAAQYDPETGMSAIDVPVSDAVMKQQELLKKAIQRAPLGSVSTGKQSLLLKLKGESDNPDLDTWLATGKTPEKQVSINLADLDDTLKQLRKDIRSAEKGKLGTPMDAVEGRKLEEALEAMRNDFLQQNNPEAYDALVKAEKSAFDEANTFRSGLAKTLLIKEGPGQYKLSDAKVISTIMRNKDPAAAEEISDILKADPKALQETQNYLFALYRRSVADGNEMTARSYKKHKAFMENYGPVLDKFFTQEQSVRIRELGGFADVVAKNADRLKALDAAFRASTKGQIDRMSAENLVDRVFTKSFSGEMVKDVHRVASRFAPDVLKSWQDGVANKMRERLFKDDMVDGSAMSRLMKDHDTLGKLRTIFGPQYLRNLETLHSAMNLARQTGPNVSLPGKNTLWTDLARVTYAPPLSAAGREVSLLQNTRARALANKVYRALSSPEELAKLASRTERTMRTVRNLNVAGAVGANLIGEEENVK